MKKLFRFRNLLSIFIVAVILHSYSFPFALACYEGFPICSSGCTPVNKVVTDQTGIVVDISGAFVGETATTGAHTVTFSGGTITAATLVGVTSFLETPTVSISHTTSTVSVSLTGGNTSGDTDYTIHIVYTAPSSPGSVLITNHLHTNEITPPPFFDESNFLTLTVIAANGSPTFSAMSPASPLAHTHGTHSVSVTVTDPDGDAITSVTGSGSGFISRSPASGASPLLETITLSPSFGGVTKDFKLVASDGISPSAESGTYTYTTTDAPFTIPNNCSGFPIVAGVTTPTTLQGLQADNIIGPTLVVSGLTFTPTDTDHSGELATRNAPSSPAGVTLTAGTLMTGPYTIGSSLSATFTIDKATFQSGPWIESFTDPDETKQSVCQIGLSTGGGYRLRIEYGKVTAEDATSGLPIVTYASGPLTQMCTEVTYENGVPMLPGKDLGKVEFGSIKGGGAIMNALGGGFTVGDNTFSGNTPDGSAGSSDTTSAASNVDTKGNLDPALDS